MLMQVTTLLGAAEVLAAHRARGNREYAEVAVVAVADVPGWIADRGGAAVSTVGALLERLR